MCPTILIGYSYEILFILFFLLQAHTGYLWKFLKTVNIYSIIKRANVDVTASNYTTESKQQTGRVTGFETLSYQAILAIKYQFRLKNDLFMKNIGHLKGLDCEGNNYASVSRQFVPFRTRQMRAHAIVVDDIIVYQLTAPHGPHVTVPVSPL